MESKNITHAFYEDLDVDGWTVVDAGWKTEPGVTPEAPRKGPRILTKRPT